MAGCNDYGKFPGIAFGKQVDCDTAQVQLQSLRTTGYGLQFTSESTKSNEIRTDGNVSDVIRTGTGISGPISFELSYNTLKLIFQAVFRSNTALDGAGTPIVNGVASHYFTFEQSIIAGLVTYYEQFYGCEIDTLSVTFALGEPVTGEFTVLGRTATESDSDGSGSIDPDGYDPAGSEDVYNTNSMIGVVEFDDGTLAASFRAFTMSYSTNKREQKELGEIGSSGFGEGDFDVILSAELNFLNNLVFKRYLADDLLKVHINVDDLSDSLNGNQMDWLFPKTRITSYDKPITGSNEDIIVNFEMQSIYDDGIGGTAQMFTLDAAPTP